MESPTLPGRTGSGALSGRLLTAFVVVAVRVASMVLILSLTRLRRTMSASSELVRFREMTEEVVLEADLALLSGDSNATQAAIAAAEAEAARFLEEIGPVVDAEGDDVRDRFRESWGQVVMLGLAYTRGEGDVGAIDAVEHEMSHEADELAAALTDRSAERLRLLRQTIKVVLAVIVVAAILVAHTLGLGVVAEGVERADQLAVVEEMECDLVQGFYYSPAVPAEGFERFLTEQPPWFERQDAA